MNLVGDLQKLTHKLRSLSNKSFGNKASGYDEFAHGESCAYAHAASELDWLLELHDSLEETDWEHVANELP